MEDLTSIMPSITDLNELNCRDEEEYDDSGPFFGDYGEVSRSSCLAESIFCSGSLSTTLLTQAV